MEKIMWEKVDVKELCKGDDVFDEERKVGLVTKERKTLLHKHPYIIIEYKWVTMSGDIRYRIEKYYLHNCNEKFYLIRWSQKTQKTKA